MSPAAPIAQLGTPRRCSPTCGSGASSGRVAGNDPRSGVPSSGRVGDGWAGASRGGAASETGMPQLSQKDAPSGISALQLAQGLLIVHQTSYVRRGALHALRLPASGPTRSHAISLEAIQNELNTLRVLLYAPRSATRPRIRGPPARWWRARYPTPRNLSRALQESFLIPFAQCRYVAPVGSRAFRGAEGARAAGAPEA